METLSFTEALHSRSNRFFLELRGALKFRRRGYAESGAEALELSPAGLALEARYGMAGFRPLLKESTYQKNISTLSWLENLRPFLRSLPKKLEVLETGVQDFSRLPAIRSFFSGNDFLPSVTGIELDPYPVLVDLHSRADKAEYYLSLTPGDRFLAADFFQWHQPADCILSFYPFVSAHPALSWGLPADFGNAGKWVESFVRNLSPGGLLLVVHQGEWEEKEFDQARTGKSLELLQRTKADVSILPLPHPPCLSIYRRY